MPEHEQKSLIADLSRATCELQIKVLEISREHGMSASYLFEYVSRVVAQMGSCHDVDHLDTSENGIADARRYATIRANNL